MLVIPLGIGLAVPAMTTALLSAVPRMRSGIASGALNTVRQAGGAIGVALFGSLLARGSGQGVLVVFISSAVVVAVAALVEAVGVWPAKKVSQ